MDDVVRDVAVAVVRKRRLVAQINALRTENARLRRVVQRLDMEMHLSNAQVLAYALLTGEHPQGEAA